MNCEYTPSFLEHEHEHIPVLVDEYALRKDVHTYLVGNQYVHVVCSNYMTYQLLNNDDEHIATVQKMVVTCTCTNSGDLINTKKLSDMVKALALINYVFKD